MTVSPRETFDARVPAWLREVELSVVTNPQLIVYGNVRDRYLLPDGSGGWSFSSITDALTWSLRRLGYPLVLRTDVVDGLAVLPDDAEARTAAERLLDRVPDAAVPLSLARLYETLRQVVRQTDHDDPAVGAVVVDYAARLVRDLPHLGENEHTFFAGCEKLAQEAESVDWADGSSRYNPVIWIVNHERELPSWFLTGNEAIRRIAVPVPDLDDRHVAAQVLAPGLVGPEAGPEERAAVAARFAEGTQGLTLRSMLDIVQLSRSGIHEVDSVEDAVRCYRVGIIDSPWGKSALRDRLADADERLGRRLRGQAEAVERSIDIVVRSVVGLSGAQVSAGGARPRGVLFFAGPTGVGKTELAKALTELIFGDERAYIRFDMSEFAAEHASERLVGAPPGYLGHDAGGELTNALRRQPFSLVLFDEIEKAHPRILDKFLQILDDGRLTDGSGSTVYFSEAVIVFTSNLGMKVRDESGRAVDNVTRAMPRQEFEERMTRAVREHFTETLNRPELLNRIGDNIVVFNFITTEAAYEIFDSQVRRVLGRIHRQDGVRIDVAERDLDMLRDAATADLSFGGRGIGSFLERAFVNPLARALFAQGVDPPRHLWVTDLTHHEGHWSLDLTAHEPVSIHLGSAGDA